MDTSRRTSPTPGSDAAIVLAVARVSKRRSYSQPSVMTNHTRALAKSRDDRVLYLGQEPPALLVQAVVMFRPYTPFLRP